MIPKLPVDSHPTSHFLHRCPSAGTESLSITAEVVGLRVLPSSLVSMLRRKYEEKCYQPHLLSSIKPSFCRGRCGGYSACRSCLSTCSISAPSQWSNGHYKEGAMTVRQSPHFKQWPCTVLKYCYTVWVRRVHIIVHPSKTRG
jgi:hypothetical protein